MKKTEHVHFVSARDARRDYCDEPDRDGYLSGLSEADLEARKCPGDLRAYRRVASEAMRDAPPEARAALKALANASDARFRALGRRGDGQLSAACRVLAAMPWKFATFRGRAYEGGYPHTRDDVVFLPEHVTPDVELLMHEKVHVFQRWHPGACAEIYRAEGFARIGERDEFRARRDPNIRSNPDLDRYVYAKDGRPCYVRYADPAASRDMARTETVGPTEHPNEWMAYRLSRL